MSISAAISSPSAQAVSVPKLYWAMSAVDNRIAVHLVHSLLRNVGKASL